MTLKVSTATETVWAAERLLRKAFLL